jgi:hypothetical protein
MLRRILIALLLILGLCLVAAAPNSKLLFHDKFKDGNDEGWTQVNRYWHVRDGRYYLDGDYMPNHQGRDGFSYTHINDRAWKNYVYEFTFAPINGEGNPNQAFVKFRVQDPLKTEYRLSLWVPGDPGSNTGLEKYVNGKRTSLGVWEPVARYGKNKGKVVVQEGHITVHINGKKVIDYTDPKPIRYGGIGVGALWELNAWFDDIKVTAKK